MSFPFISEVGCGFDHSVVLTAEALSLLETYFRSPPSTRLAGVPMTRRLLLSSFETDNPNTLDECWAVVWILSTKTSLEQPTNQPAQTMRHLATEPVVTRFRKRVPQRPSSLHLQQQPRPNTPRPSFYALLPLLVVAMTLFGGLVQAQQPSEDTCLWNNLEFTRGESFGSAFATQCSPTSDFPCFCNPDLAPFPADCPYCSFPQLGTDDLACARDGETISFVDVEGINQQCSCSISSTPGALPITSCNSGDENNGGMPTVSQGTSRKTFLA
jgi:hypothetical protein